MRSGNIQGNQTANGTTDTHVGKKAGTRQIDATSSKDPSREDAQTGGTWTSFLKSIASFNGDLSSLTAPPFILSTKSLVEYSTHWAEHPSIFVAPVHEEDPAKRALLVLKWFITTLKQQYCSRSEKLGSEKKPLNPFLGELFIGRWSEEIGATQLVSEQVSHHPPITAYCILNQNNGIRLHGYSGQKTSFSGGRINVKQVGHAVLQLEKYKEEYLITLPSLHIEGLITGSPYVELERSSYIQSSTGFVSKIDYSGKGWISGKKNSFVASLYTKGQENNALYKIDGQWSKSFTIRDKRRNKDLETVDLAAIKTKSLQVAPIDEQDPLESRRAWQKVAEAIRKGDMNTTSTEKSAIENMQRALRKKEKEEGMSWSCRFFKKTEPSPVLKSLATSLGENLNSDITNGVWVFDSTKSDPFSWEG